MFLSIMILLQNQLPCTENFFRYQKNFEKYVNSEENKTENAEGEQKTKIIASPRMIAKLSPMASLAKKEGVNFNPPSQAKLLQYYANKDSKKEESKEETAQVDDQGVPSQLPQSNKEVQAAKKARAEQMEELVAKGED